MFVFLFVIPSYQNVSLIACQTIYIVPKKLHKVIMVMYFLFKTFFLLSHDQGIELPPPLQISLQSTWALKYPLIKMKSP